MNLRLKIAGVGVAVLALAEGGQYLMSPSFFSIVVTTLVGGTAMAVLVPLLVHWDIVAPVSTMVRRLSENASQVVAAAGQVANSSQSLSQGATEQATSLEQTSASMEEMASMTRKNAEN